MINTESAGKERTQLTKAIVLAIRELMRQAEPDAHTRDLAAFIALALEEIHNTIDLSVAAWEKRDYWVKADRFRMEWAWSGSLAGTMRSAVMTEDWPTVALVSAKVAQKLGDIKVPQRNRIGEPWVGAWDRLHSNHH